MVGAGGNAHRKVSGMELIIITGMSGAGKTRALREFEDAGYFCIDNLPCEMSAGLVELCRRANPPVERAAVVIDSRESIFRPNMREALKGLTEIGVECRVVFLDCRDEILERRYSETRRRHPLCDNIREGIHLERELMSGIRDRANVIIDTSALKPMELKAVLERELALSGGFVLRIMSFGYKRGLPFEADIVMDMRFSPNPFYEDKLRPLSGLDEPVAAFVLSDERVDSMLDELEGLLDRLIPGYIAQGKHQLTIAFGCTGGRHRSVCAAQELHRRMNGRYTTALAHRDLASEGADIHERMGGRRG